MLLWPPHINQATLWRCALGEITGLEKLADITEHLRECHTCQQTLEIIYQAAKAPKPTKGFRPAPRTSQN
jgi:hypothetical protein